MRNGDNMHTPHKEVLIKFILLLSVLFGYFIYLSWKFDIGTGGIIALLTWSFFVLCTPIADAGFLLDFPLRLLFGVRMVISEMVVWACAITINGLALTYARDAYQKTVLTFLFEKILTTPVPYWLIIIISCIGTFLSVRLGDELMDVAQHSDRVWHHKHGLTHTLLMYAGFFLLAFWGYHYLIESLDIKIP